MFAQVSNSSAFTNRCLAAAVVAGLASAGAAAPVKDSWKTNGPGPHNWSLAANWDGGTTPGMPGTVGGGDEAKFGKRAANGAAVTVTLDNDAELSKLTFDNSTNYTLSPAMGKKLKLVPFNGLGPTIFVGNADGNAAFDITAPVEITNSGVALAAKSTNANSLRFSGEISSPGVGNFGGITVSNPAGGEAGAGTIVFAAKNTYAGKTTVQGGLLLISDKDALGDAAKETLVTRGSVGFMGGLNAVPEPFTLSGPGLASRGALLNLGGVNKLSGVLTIVNNSTIGTEGAAGDALQIDGKITSRKADTWTLSKAGDRILVLNASNDYTGATMIKAGIVTATADAAFGTANAGFPTFVESGAAINLALKSYKTAETINLAGIGFGPGGTEIGALTTATGADLIVSFDGSTQLRRSAAANTPVAVGAETGRTLVLNGELTDAKVIGAADKVAQFQKLANGVVILNSADNSYRGATVVRAGTLAAGKDRALGLANGDDATGTTVEAGATLRLDASYTRNEKLTLSGTGVGASGALQGAVDGDFAGPVSLAANSNVGVAKDRTLNLTKAVSGGGKLTKVGEGTLSLRAAGAYTGGTSVDKGYLEVSADKALGPGAGVTAVTDGATLVFNQVNYTAGDQVIEVAGKGVDGKIGAIHGRGPDKFDNIFKGTVKLTANATLSAATGTTLTISKVDKNGKDVTFAPRVNGRNKVETVTGPNDVFVDGEGVVEFSQVSDFQGPTLINAGTLVVNGEMSASTAFGVAVGIEGALGGSGQIGRPVTVQPGGIVSPGDAEFDPTGDLLVSSINMQPGAVLRILLMGSDVNTLLVGGLSNSVSGALLVLDPESSPELGMEYTLIDTVGGPALAGLQRFDDAEGLIVPLSEGDRLTAPNGIELQLTYFGGSGTDVVLRAVPEPAVAGALVAAALLGVRRRNRR